MYDFLPPIFKGLATPDVATALQRFQTLEVEAGVRVIEEGDEDPTLCVVHTGELVVKTGETRLGKASAGDLLGEMALFAGGMRSASVETLTPCKLLVLDWENYDYLRRAKHPIAFAIEDGALETLTDRLRKVGERISRMAEGTPVQHVRPPQGFFGRVSSMLGSGGVFPARVDGPAVLAKSPLFAGARPEVLAEVAATFTPVGASKGHFLCTEGEQGDEMYLIATGLVDVLVATHGDKVEVVATLEPGEAFGMCTLVQPGQPRMASCVVKDRMTALSMDKLKWAETATRGDLVGSVLRVAMIRALADQLAYANAQLARLAHERTNLAALMKAGAGVEAHGRFLAEDEDVPDYLKGVDEPW